MEEHFLQRFYDSRIVKSDLREHIKRSRFGYCIKSGDTAQSLVMGKQGNLDFVPEFFRKEKNGNSTIEQKLLVYKIGAFLIVAVIKDDSELEPLDH